jgi:hypothetical protein
MFTESYDPAPVRAAIAIARERATPTPDGVQVEAEGHALVSAMGASARPTMRPSKNVPIVASRGDSTTGRGDRQEIDVS